MQHAFLSWCRRGFTLVEVIVATVIAGFCIIPVINTMQTGISSSENFDHREKLRILARSRFNKELAAGAFEHKAIDTSTTWHYVYRTTSGLNSIDSVLASNSPELILPGVSADVATADAIIYSYEVSVHVKENVSLATTTVSADLKLLKGLPGLKAVVVMAELQDGPNVLATDSISYFSLLAVPNTGDQFIWLANSSMLRILAIDATTRSIADTFPMPFKADKGLDKPEQNEYRPWNIDLHPGRRILAIQSQNDIKLLNIDRSHDKYQQPEGLVSVASAPVPGIFATPDYDSSKARDDHGIVFRPDGRYFFVTGHVGSSEPLAPCLFVYKIDVATGALNWPPPVTFVKKFDLSGDPDTNHNKFSDLVAGCDGYLYLAVKDQKCVVRFPMYPEADSFDNWKYEKLLKP
ncbi:MAG TPA: prepilin-type N-terminal cleavage/methylation domain-containing protein, partial [Candidatus Rifleibacterium sp.]|nr:prepilin-type N-terminal cleavage/methylation domain-containing protein [Candidatus Rifleibacterium sp.]